MEALAAFLLTLGMTGILLLKIRLRPFLSLVVAALVYGQLVGMGQSELIGHVGFGLGRVFSALAIIIFSGSVIAEHLKVSRGVERIVADLVSVTGTNGMLASGIAGYLVSLPAMCCMTSYLILEPVVKCLGQEIEGSGVRFQFMTAASSVISFNLIYPSPVMIALTGNFDVSSAEVLKAGLPISLLLLLVALIYMVRLPAPKTPITFCRDDLPSRVRSWAPLLLPILLILGGFIFPGRSFASPNMALLIGALASVALSGDKADAVIRSASRRAGIIIFDLSGAGAFGYVIGQSGLAEDLTSIMDGAIPAVVLPFLVAAILQLAQGSRVVTAVIASEMLRGYPLEGTTMIFLICAGAFTFSYVSDPYFWLVKKTAKTGMKETFFGYTLPLTICGLLVFGTATLRWFLFL